MSLGFVGTEATIAFHGYVKTIDAQVTGKEIIEEFGKVKKKIDRLGQEKLNVAIEKMADYVTKNLTTLDDNQGKNLKAFMESLPAELRVAAWSKFTAHGVEKLELTKSIHKWCVTSILEALSVPKEDVEKAAAGVKAPKKKGK